MRKLAEVEEAKHLMYEAIDWSVWKWMFEKPRVRETADRANDALDHLERNIKARWSEQIKAASVNFRLKLQEPPGETKKCKKLPPADPQIILLVERVKEADDAAHRARTDAEKTFDEAERKLSTSLAREGCQKAIQSWTLHEKAIRKAESVMELTNTSA